MASRVWSASFSLCFTTLPVEFVDHAVDGGIQIFLFAFDEDVLATYMNRYFRFLPELCH